jgi:hypothetical protein
MSFYLTLSSDGGRDTFPNNHGGDFTVQLDKILDMRAHSWEVALVEMIYTGQAFPNMGIEDSQVTLKASGKPLFENDYIITFDQAIDLWISFSKERYNVVGSKKSNHFNLPLQHYSWITLVETLQKLCLQEFNMGNVSLTEKHFTFSEKNITLDVLFRMNMSDEFSALFGIDKKFKPVHDHNSRWVHYQVDVTKIPKPATDSSQVFYTPFALNKNCKIMIGDEVIFQLTLQYWSVNMFKRAINALGKKLNKDSNLSSMSIEDGANENECTIVLTANKIKSDSSVTLSVDFMIVFHASAISYTINALEPLKIPLSIGKAPEENRQWPTFEAGQRLQHNYYPDIDSLVKELNQVLTHLKVDIAKQRNSSTAEFAFFDVKNNVVTFHEKESFTVLLSTGLLKMMHLPSSWLTKSVVGSQAVTMKTYKRSHFYIHLDCLDYHYINNNVSDLIKVVPNSAALDEKLQLTFSDPHYYAVAKRYMSTINMYVTDSYFDGILPFDRDIAYTLHFRKCLHSL